MGEGDDAVFRRFFAIPCPGRNVAWIVYLLCVLTCAGIISATSTPVGCAGQQPAQSQPRLEISAPSAILMDSSSGRVLYERDAHKRMPPASITKIMTMLLAMEALEAGKISLNDKVIASEHACSMGGSQVWLEPGEEMLMSDMLKAIAVVSANDCSVAVAEHIAGAEEIFVDMMNARAKELGMNDTHFVNATGLPHPDHYTSAYDIALMSRELLKHPKVHEWFTIWIDYLRDGKNILVNTNRLIKDYKGADGLKTGYTEEAKYCLAATAKRDGLRLISVVLGVPDSRTRFNEAARLLDYGFRYYVGVEVARAGDIVTQAPVQRGVAETVSAVAKGPLTALAPRGEEKKIKTEIRLDERITAPITKGQKLGELVALLDGEEVARVDLVAGEDVKKANIFQMFFRIIRNLFRMFLGRGK
ncbi:MAG TPA: D-alanyl-D-alanine carboxypeptidase [Firmicutes bacterium]|nr:D-alanyl-D-alanine carboxypeptidase [Bacillota bacterium]